MAKGVSSRLDFLILLMDLGKWIQAILLRVYSSYISTSVNLFKPEGEVFTKDRASFLDPIDGTKQFERGF